MAITINGTTGLAGVDGSAGTPSYQGGDSNTGIFFPAADTIAFAEGGAEVARFNSVGNLGIGTTSPTAMSTNYTTVDVRGSSGGAYRFGNSTDSGYLYSDSNETNLASATSKPLLFSTNATERARIDSSGNLLVGTTSQFSGSGIVPKVSIVGTDGLGISGLGASQVGLATKASSTSNYYAGFFLNSSSTGVGNITVSTTATAYNTSSDYRLKHDIAPMTGALAKVAALKPVTYKWKADGTPGQGFIAHELAEVVPDAVTGEKDAVDAEGNPVYQGIDTSFLVATLTAAIQEQQALIESLTARIAALEAA